MIQAHQQSRRTAGWAKSQSRASPKHCTIQSASTETGSWTLQYSAKTAFPTRKKFLSLSLNKKTTRVLKNTAAQTSFFPLPLCWYCDRHYDTPSIVWYLVDLGQGWDRSMCSYGERRWLGNTAALCWQHHLSYKICIKWKHHLPCTHTNTNTQDWVFEKKVLFGPPNVENYAYANKSFLIIYMVPSLELVVSIIMVNSCSQNEVQPRKSLSQLQHTATNTCGYS